MNPWPFVIAAWSLVVLVAGVLSIVSWRAMRRAERAADRPRR